MRYFFRSTIAAGRLALHHKYENPCHAGTVVKGGITLLKYLNFKQLALKKITDAEHYHACLLTMPGVSQWFFFQHYSTFS